jgi:hypothetical protein
MREEMVRRDQVDVVDVVKTDHPDYSLTQLLQRQGFPNSIPGDLMILTIDAPERASRKENRTRSPWSANGRFLPEMRPYKGDAKLVSLSAESLRAPVVSCSIDPTGPGAKGTFLI